MTTAIRLALVVPLATIAVACAGPPPSNALTASGNVEATEVQVAPEVGGRILEMRVAEGDRVAAGAVIATLDTPGTPSCR
jgi:HlyD family secretion protein